MESEEKARVQEKEILKLIPTFESYMEYMIELLIKLPRTGVGIFSSLFV